MSKLVRESAESFFWIQPNAMVADDRIRQNQFVDAIGMRRSKQLSHQSALGQAQKTGSLDADSVHDCSDVTDPLLQRRYLVEPVGNTDSPLVELDGRHVAADVVEHSAVQLLLPNQFDVRNQRRNNHHRGTRTEYLVGEIHSSALGVSGVGNLHC